MKHDDCDVCVVGAGPAGLTVAKTLSSRGLNVTVVESGDRNVSVNAQDLITGGAVGYPYHPLERALFNGVGGSALLWTGNNRFRPLDAVDFEDRPGVPHSGWPFDLDHLWPFYERAHEILPLGPTNYSVDYWLEPGKSSPFSLPKEVDTAIFQVTPDGDAAARAIADLARGSDLRVMTGTTATELVTTEDGTRIDVIQLKHADGMKSVLHAHAFVLAAGALDNTRLLLVSNDTWKNGLGNTEDLVGRYFMEHPGVRSSVLVPNDYSLFDGSRLYGLHTVRATRIIGTLTLAEEVVRREGLLNAAIFLEPSDDLRTSDVYRSMAMFSLEGIRNMRWPSSVYADNLANVVRHPIRAVSTLVGLLNRHFPPRRRVFDVRVVSEQAPNPGSRVFLDAKRDSDGLPRVRLDWRFTELDTWSIRRTQEILRDSLRSAGLGTLSHLYGEERPPARIHGQRHQIGTTRMHRDPKLGVVDPNSKVHGLQNLFLTGSSVFPTGGHANPTLTIVALALRLADHLSHVLESRQGLGGR